MKFLTHSYEKIFNLLPEGLVIMDEARTIHYMNQSAGKLTGWREGDSVPYCSYCKQREIVEGENRCILTAENPVPFFHSHMAIYSGIEEEFEMSLKKMAVENEHFYLLRLSQPIQNENSEKAKFHELLVHETMLAQEAERRKIARELHDHIAQSVYSIFLGLEGMKDFLNNERYESHLANMTRVMERTLDDIKRLTKNLRPDTVYHLGLRAALLEAKSEWEQFYQVDIQLEMDLQKADWFDKENELHLFRIIQEAVSNAVKHGDATKIKIHLKSTNQYIFFKITDNGKGFDVEATRSKGLGLRHMYERCLMMGGDITWVSNYGGPTKVEGFVEMIKQGEDFLRDEYYDR